jgi:DNA-binding CsgD family transcriptional regulator
MRLVTGTSPSRYVVAALSSATVLLTASEIRSLPDLLLVFAVIYFLSPPNSIFTKKQDRDKTNGDYDAAKNGTKKNGLIISGFIADAIMIMVTAIRRVLAGGKYISQSLAQRLAFNIGADYQQTLRDKLSDREYRVICMTASGKTVSDIAEELSLSVKTISTCRSRILEKMHMKNNAELTYCAIHNQLVY